MIIFRSSTIRFILLLAVYCNYAPSLYGQQRESTESSVQLQLWRDHYVQLATKLKFLVGDNDPTEAALRSKPLHFFSNPAGGTQSHGSIFVWTKDERPVVVGALWSRQKGETRRVSGSFHSTALGTLRGVGEGIAFWQPKRSLVMKPWPRDTARAASAPLRLVQMKNMMRALEATRFHEDQQSRLRVLPQPLYRYRNSQVTDGAIFGFFDNWDPELFVLIETRTEQPGGWMIGIVRFSNKRLVLKLARTPIWEYDPDGTEPPLGGPDFLYLSKSIEIRPIIFDERSVPEPKP